MPPINFSALAQGLQGSMAQPVADKNNPLGESLEPGMGLTEGGRGYPGTAAPSVEAPKPRYGDARRAAAMLKNPVVETARLQLEQQLDQAAMPLKEFDKYRPQTKGPIGGLIPDAIKATPEYRQARTAYDQAFSALRAFNHKFKP